MRHVQIHSHHGDQQLDELVFTQWYYETLLPLSCRNIGSGSGQESPLLEQLDNITISSLNYYLMFCKGNHKIVLIILFK